jgi:hypothetical protein
MENIIVYVDDADHARGQLPLAADGSHWILVACAPRMTHRISKWVSHSARENWRAKWADKLFAQVVPPLMARGDRVTTVLAKGPLPELTEQLAAEHGARRIVDARRPKFDGAAYATPRSFLGLGLALILAAD